MDSFKVGDILINSWGYDMTINDYCRITELSPTKKTIKCRMLKQTIENDYGRGAGRSMPTSEEKGEPFKLFVRNYSQDNLSDRLYFVGSYPFCDGDKQKGSFSIWNGKPDYYNTWD